MNATTKEQMTFEQFKARLVAQRGERGVSFRETGKHGWTTIEDILDRKPGGHPGPHWCDAAPIPAGYYLLGKYDFNSGEATFFGRGV